MGGHSTKNMNRNGKTFNKKHDKILFSSFGKVTRKGTQGKNKCNDELKLLLEQRINTSEGELNDNINDKGESKECNISNDGGRNGHDNKAFLHTEETTSGSSSGSSTSSPEPPVNFELRDMSPNTHPKIISSNSMEKVPIDALDGMTEKEKEGRFGDDYLISINEHQRTGIK